MSINVTVVGSTNITAVIGNNDGVDVAIGGTLAYSPLTALQVTAGANITITTTSGVYTFIGPDVPVQQVNGQTGNVSLTLANLTAAAASHTHVMSDISDLVFPVTKVNGKTGDVSLTVTDLTAALAVHTHSTTDVVGFTAAASAAAPVQQVAGRTGVISLVAADVSGLAPVATSGSYTSLSDIPTSFTPSSHTHQASEITNLTSVANVVSVNGQTGVAVLSSTDVSAASAVHSHVAADVTDLTSVANVVSVNGITGTPVIVGGSGVTVSTAGSSITIEASGGTGGGAALSDATPQPLGTAAAGTSALASRADHVHDLPTISYTSLSDVPTAFAPDTSVANVVSVNGQTGAVNLTSVEVSAASAVHSHVMADVTDLSFPVSSVNGQAGTVSLTSVEVSAASAVHTHAMADVTDLAFPVSSVNGQTGTVSLTSVEVSAASAVHTHVASDVTDLTSVANVVSVNGITGTPSIVAGTNVTVTTAASSITIDAGGGSGGSGDAIALSYLFS
jgi:hypothetical protein